MIDLREKLGLPADAPDGRVLGRLEALLALERKTEASGLVAEGIRAGKIADVRGVREYWYEAAVADLAAARLALGLAEAAQGPNVPAPVAEAERPPGSPPDTNNAPDAPVGCPRAGKPGSGLTAREIEACRRTGVDPDAYRRERTMQSACTGPADRLQGPCRAGISTAQGDKAATLQVVARDQKA
jgi:hypothetical protein